MPNDDAFQKRYARAMDLRNDFWADELVDTRYRARVRANSITFDPRNKTCSAKRTSPRHPGRLVLTVEVGVPAGAAGGMTRT
jgi:hypothetical protein